MTQPSLNGDGALRAAVLAAVELYLSQEQAAPIPESPTPWRRAGRPQSRLLRQPVQQPTLWRTMGWANTRFANRTNTPGA